MRAANCALHFRGTVRQIRKGCGFVRILDSKRLEAGLALGETGSILWRGSDHEVTRLLLAKVRFPFMVWY